MRARIISSVIGVIILVAGYFYSASFLPDGAFPFKVGILLVYASLGCMWGIYEYVRWLWRGK